jgi:uncharacterized phage-associated protein
MSDKESTAAWGICYNGLVSQNRTQEAAMPYPAAAIANEFIKLARESKRPLSPLKLQKLVYFAHGWYLALVGKPLINEPVQAWKFGPVIPSLYHAFKHYEKESVTNSLPGEDVWSPLVLGGPVNQYSVDDGPDEGENEVAKQIIKRVWEVYGRFSAVQLSNLTHAPDSPWSNTPDKDKRRSVEIDQDLIRAYFLKQAEQNRQKRAQPA